MVKVWSAWPLRFRVCLDNNTINPFTRLINDLPPLINDEGWQADASYKSASTSALSLPGKLVAPSWSVGLVDIPATTKTMIFVGSL